MARSFADLHPAAELACVLCGDADDAFAQALRDAGAELNRRAVVRDGDRVAAGALAGLGVPGRARARRAGALERQLGDAVARGAREERPVADEAEAPAFRAG